MSGEPATAEFDAVLAGARRSHERLQATVDGLTPDDVRARSLLPEWTAGHVLTHLARNAESHTRMLRGAIEGKHLEQYAGGREQRAADIEAGAARSGVEILDDVARSTAELEATWSAMTEEAWDGHGLSAGRLWPCRQTVFHRWREVELHHVDLGLAYGPDDLPDEYVAVELPIALSMLPERLDHTGRAALFAWLVGRRPQPTLDPAPWQSTRYSRGGPFSGA